MADPRLPPSRADLAAKYLEGKVSATRIVEGAAFEVAEAIAPLREQPVGDAALLTQALRGERVTVYDRNGEGWAFGQLDNDGYVGWLPDSALVEPGPAPTHKVTAIRTFGFGGPSIKLPPLATLPMGSTLTVLREDGGFAATSEGLFLPTQHLSAIAWREADFVDVAERFVGTPYLWGGKTSLGIDCSGLVQVSLNAAGIGCPRDSDMQQDRLGRPIDAVERNRLSRGDLLFWDGHVAIARDAATIVHANAHHMATVIEGTSDAISRISQAGLELLAIKRL